MVLSICIYCYEIITEKLFTRICTRSCLCNSFIHWSNHNHSKNEYFFFRKENSFVFLQIGSCVFTAYILDRIETDISLHFSWFPVLIIGLSVYISSSIFLDVYSTATSTLFFCVLYDLEVHDDPQMESYIMSDRLKKIFNKSNDFRKNKFQIIQ
jgi:hypothetical protein